MGAATQTQRWRDFSSHLVAYAVMNLMFVIVWLSTGRGDFWPAYPLVGWGLGLSFQHFNMVLRGQISDGKYAARWLSTRRSGGGKKQHCGVAVAAPRAKEERWHPE